MKKALFWFVLGTAPLSAIELQLLPEYLRTDPTGVVVPQDQTQAGKIELRAARGGYLSFQVLVKLKQPSTYGLHMDRVPSPFEVDLFKEWYHRLHENGHYVPDALIPVKLPFQSTLPEKGNRITAQTSQAFWVDLWIPQDAPAGQISLTINSRSQEGTAKLEISVTVMSDVIPKEDAVTVDHNSYGTSWLKNIYPSLASKSGNFFESDRFFDLIDAYHRIFYEHRGIYHQLGYGHAGKVGPEFAPALKGSGRSKHVSDWSLFDRHYGPLFDGTAFEKTRRGPRPIPFAYLPINPEWPASYLWWGEPGYEAEFQNVVGEMERHFRERGWTNTRLELFFNHKKRYMGFPWDGDEVRFLGDDQYLIYFGRLLKESLPPKTPVKFAYRVDASWALEAQAKELKGLINLWVCNGDILSWYPEVARELKRRGDIVWYYAGPPPVTLPSARITELPLRAWLWGIDGFVHWQTVAAGADPWFDFDGGGTALVYPGDRFGIAGPIPSIRLKLQRTALQDLALLNAFSGRSSPNELRSRAAELFNGSKPKDWWNARPAMADQPPDEWIGSSIDAAVKKTREMSERIEPDAWQRIHDYVMSMARERQP